MELPPSYVEPPDPPPAPKSATPYEYVPRPTDDTILPRWRGQRIFGSIAGAMMVLLIAGYYLNKRRQAAVDIPRPQFGAVSQWTSDSGVSIAPAFSFDGKLLAYSSDRDGPGNLAIWVRPYPSGPPRRLTNQEFNARDPDFSPDSSLIVYQSDRDGGGIYIMPVSGASQPRLLAKGGIRPRFSSDGKWIAYYAMPGESENTSRPGGRLYIVPLAGGDPKRIRADFADARYPVWHTGNELLLFEGKDSTGATDWWVTPIDEGATIRTHAFETLNSAVGVHTAPDRWVGDKILFSATDQSNLHVWELGISPQSWQAFGTPRPLTGGEGIEQSSAVGRDGRMLFARMQLSVDVWSLPLAADSAAGSLQRVTSDHAINQAPTAGSNATKVVYVSNRTGLPDVWLHDLKTGAEFAVTSYQNIAYRPVLSANEDRIAYRTTVNGECAIILKELSGSGSKQVATGCFNIWDWSPDGSSLLIYNSAETVVSAQLLNTDSGHRQPLLSHPTFSIFDGGFSRDGKWIAFTAGANLETAEIFGAPFRGTAVEQGEWIPITKGHGSLSAWSPNSDILYFHSQRDGFHCIWAQKLNSAKHPIGDPYAIQHLHSVSLGMHMIKPNDFRMSATKDRLLLNLASETANLWIMDKHE